MRVDRNEYYLQMAELVASRSTCLRRAVGCVLTNARGHVLATGHNGRPAGWPHCNDSVPKGEGYKQFGSDPNVQRPSCVVTTFPFACAGAIRADGKRAHRSGTNLDACEAIHAEQNALLQCGDPSMIDTCYVTVSPCITCVKLLLNTACRMIIFRTPYAHNDAAEALWRSDYALIRSVDPSGTHRGWMRLGPP